MKTYRVTILTWASLVVEYVVEADCIQDLYHEVAALGGQRIITKQLIG